MDSARQTQARDSFELRFCQSLMERGVVTCAELDEALEQQVILGGHLATNLWELGLAESSVLDRLTGEILRLPVAAPEEVLAAPPELHRYLSTELVERTRIVPLRFSGRILHVATCEPWNEDGAKQVTISTGKLLSLHFLGEIDFMKVAARIYGVPLSARFTLGRNLFRKRGAARPEDAGQPPALEDLMPEDCFESIYSEQPEPVVDLDPVPEESEADYEDEILDLVDEVLEDEDEPSADSEEEEIDIDVEMDEPRALEALLPLPRPPSPPRPIARLDEATAFLASATGRDDLGMVLLRFALGRGRRAVLLTRRGNVWFGWLGAGPGIAPEAIPGLMLPSEPGTAFGLVGQTGAPFLGPLLPHPVHDAFLTRLGKQRPGSVGLFPVHHRGKLVFGIYLDGGHGENVAPDVGEILVLAQKAAMALQRLVTARTAR